MLGQNNIVFVPTDGLCNRMRSIASAVSLSKHLSRELEVIWLINRSLGCPFNQLFKPLPSIRVIQSKKLTNHLYQDRDYVLAMSKDKCIRLMLLSSSRLYKNLMYDDVIDSIEMADISPADLTSKVAKSRRPLLITNREFYKDFKPNSYDFFRPIDELERQIKERIAGFNEYTIAIHIRRGDHKKSILNSPSSLFETVVSNEIDINSKVNFYVASDSVKDKQYLSDRFGSRIIADFRETSRYNSQGLQAALIDLYSLSRCCKIYGSYWSSFSRVAADISGIELITLTQL